MRRRTYSHDDLAILRSTKRQKILGAFVVVIALPSMYLFSVLGVQGAPSNIIGLVGALDRGTLGAASLIEMFVLAFNPFQN